MSNTLVPTWTIGDRLRKAREVAGIGVAEMADRIGRSRNSVTNYEAGRRAASVEVVTAYAAETGVSVAWLIQGEGGPDTVTLRVPDLPGHRAFFEPLPTAS